MKTVLEIAREIVVREGGFVDDPADPGGATKHGVTIGTLRRLGMDLNDDGLINTADVHLIDADRAAAIFVQHYFNGPRIDLLPAMMQPSVFDMYVNAGGNAVKILQRLLNTHGAKLRADGAIGPMTAGAARRVAMSIGAQGLTDAYGVARRDYYYRLGDARPASRKYALRRDGGKGGWITRAEEFIRPHLHLSAAQHRARVAVWA